MAGILRKIHDEESYTISEKIDIPAAGVSVWCSENNYYIKNQTEIQINGCVKPPNVYKLMDKSVLLFPDKSIWVFYDQKAEETEELTRLTRTKTTSQIEHTKALDDFKEKAKEKLSAYFREYGEIYNLKQFAILFCRFIKKECNIDRIIFYKVMGKRWIPLYAEAPEKKYKPPMSLLRKVYNTGDPLIHQTIEHDDNSLSIINNKIQTAYIIPIYHPKIKICIGVIYADSCSSSMNHDNNFLIISYLCDKINKYIQELLKPNIPKLKELKL